MLVPLSHINRDADMDDSLMNSCFNWGGVFKRNKAKDGEGVLLFLGEH